MNRKLYSKNSWEFITPDKAPFLITFQSENFKPERSGIEFSTKNEAKIELQVGHKSIPVKLAKIGGTRWNATHYMTLNGNEIVRGMVIEATGDDLTRATSMDNYKRNFIPACYRSDSRINLYSMINNELPKVMYARIAEVRDNIQTALNVRFGGAAFYCKWTSVQNIEMSYDAPLPPGEELTQSDFFKQCIAQYTKRLATGNYKGNGAVTPILENVRNDEHPDAPGLPMVSGHFEDKSEFISYTKYIPPPHYMDVNGLHRMEWRPTKRIIKRLCKKITFDSEVELKSIIHELRDQWDQVLTDAFNTNLPWNDTVKLNRLRTYLQIVRPKHADYLFQQIVNNRPLSPRDKHAGQPFITQERDKEMLFKRGWASLWYFNWEKLQ